MKRKQQQRGFTLVELAVVVAIIGILATLATVGYSRLVRSSYITEATRMVNAVRIAQETVKAETGSYANLGLDIMCPQNVNAPVVANARQKTPWAPACNSGSGQWNQLPVTTDGPVRYGYGTIANTGPGSAIAIGGFMAGAGYSITGTPPQNWYVVGARGDMDGNGTSSYVAGSSLSNEVWIGNEGE